MAFSKHFMVTIRIIAIISSRLNKEKYPEQAPKMPKNTDDYSDYTDILPDKKRIAKRKLD